MALAHGRRLVEEGADLLDIGAESTRPARFQSTKGKSCVDSFPSSQRSHRPCPFPSPSIHQKPLSPRPAIEAGAVMVNDVTALRGDPAMADVVAQTGAAVVLMHMQGTPQTMQQAPTYRDVVEEVANFSLNGSRFAMERGVDEIRIVLDPGIGFGKAAHA